MIDCSNCSAAAIPEYSVLIRLIDNGQEPTQAGDMPFYSRCFECGSVFQRTGPHDFVRQSERVLPTNARCAWVIPPWTANSTEAHFRLSWDLVEAFFRNAATGIELRPLRDLIRALRRERFDEVLRAGQSLYSLGLSRSLEHGLREDQDNIFLSPQRDGRLVMMGRIGGRKVDVQAITADLKGVLRQTIVNLAEAPLS